MYSFLNLEPGCCSMSGSNCCFRTCIQISQVAGPVIWYSHLFQNFPQFIVIHTVKGFSVVNKAEVDVFLELSRFFYDPTDVGNLISGSSSFSKSTLNIWKFSVHILLKPRLGNFEHYFASVWVSESHSVVSKSLPPHGLYSPWNSPGQYTGVGSLSLLQVASIWDECSCVVVWTFLEKELATHSSIHAWKIPWTEEPSRLQSMGSQRVGRDWATHTHFWTFFGIAFLWDWNENWPFPVLWPLLSIPNLLAYWMQHFHSIIF